MSRITDWTESMLIDDFPNDTQFRESGNPGHVIVTWRIQGDTRRNAPFAIVVDEQIVDAWDAASELEQDRMQSRVREIVANRRADYDEAGPVAVPEAFRIYIDAGDF